MRHSSAIHYGARRRGEAQGRHEHFISPIEAGELKRDLQGCRSIDHRHRMLCARKSGNFLLELIRLDKKVYGDAPRWILPVAIGRAVPSKRRPSTVLIRMVEVASAV